VINFTEHQAPFDQLERLTGITVWSEKAGRLAWPLSLLVIMALSIGLWAAVISVVRLFLM
jgi:hypothetical protein